MSLDSVEYPGFSLSDVLFWAHRTRIFIDYHRITSSYVLSWTWKNVDFQPFLKGSLKLIRRSYHQLWLFANIWKVEENWRDIFVINFICHCLVANLNCLSDYPWWKSHCKKQIVISVISSFNLSELLFLRITRDLIQAIFGLAYILHLLKMSDRTGFMCNFPRSSSTNWNDVNISPLPWRKRVFSIHRFIV